MLDGRRFPAGFSHGRLERNSCLPATAAQGWRYNNQTYRSMAAPS
jgi:hypothetical protein